MTTTTRAASVFAPALVSVTLAEQHNPDAFYRTRSGLYVWDSFRNLVVAKAEPTETGKTFTVKPQTLARDASDAEIEGELGGAHLFSESDACALVAALIAEQPEGEAGPLLNDGRATIIYTPSCVVFVFWYGDRRLWYVNTFNRDDYRWLAGSQVFSPAN